MRRLSQEPSGSHPSSQPLSPPSPPIPDAQARLTMGTRTSHLSDVQLYDRAHLVNTGGTDFSIDNPKPCALRKRGTFAEVREDMRPAGALNLHFRDTAMEGRFRQWQTASRVQVQLVSCLLITGITAYGFFYDVHYLVDPALERDTTDERATYIKAIFRFAFNLPILVIGWVIYAQMRLCPSMFAADTYYLLTSYVSDCRLSCKVQELSDRALSCISGSYHKSTRLRL